jgi:hypothetical protein
MGLLDGDVAALFATAFGGMYLDGTLHRGTGAPIYDGEGTITGYSGGGDLSIKVQVDRATSAMRAADGFTEGDVRLIVLAQAGMTITSDSEITARAVRYRVHGAELDAAASHWICRARAV